MVEKNFFKNNFSYKLNLLEKENLIAQETRCIKRCKKLGFLVCCFDINENCEGKKAADWFFKLSIKNYNDIMLKVSESSSLSPKWSVVSSFPNLNAYPCIPFFSVNLSNPKVREFASILLD